MDDSQVSHENFDRLLPREFLKKIPGVNSNNMPLIMDKCTNLVDVAEMPEEDLAEIVGSKNAKLIKQFLEAKVGSLD